MAWRKSWQGGGRWQGGGVVEYCVANKRRTSSSVIPLLITIILLHIAARKSTSSDLLLLLHFKHQQWHTCKPVLMYKLCSSRGWQSAGLGQALAANLLVPARPQRKDQLYEMIFINYIFQSFGYCMWIWIGPHFVFLHSGRNTCFISICLNDRLGWALILWLDPVMKTVHVTKIAVVDTTTADLQKVMMELNQTAGPPEMTGRLTRNIPGATLCLLCSKVFWGIPLHSGLGTSYFRSL